jgi:hypothetical protein
MKDKKEPRPTKADVEHYKNKWLDTATELDNLKQAIRTILEAVDVPYHDHGDD